MNGRLYRTSFAILALPLLLAAFSLARPGPLPAPLLPPSFDATSARELAVDLATQYPSRAPGSAGSLGAAQWFRDRMAQYGLPVASQEWTQTVAGLGRVPLRNLWAMSAGESRDAIVVVAHRDDLGDGAGANADASGTATLVELARTYARPETPAQQRVRSAHTIVFLSTDGGAFGAIGAERFAARAPFPILAVLDLGSTGGRGWPRVDIVGDTPRSPAATLVATVARRLTDQAGEPPDRVSVIGQLTDLGLPLALGDQGPFVARGVPAVAVSTPGPHGVRDRPESLDIRRMRQVGQAAEAVVASLDQGFALAQGNSSFIWLGGRIVRGWAVELLLVALTVPFLAGTVDLFALCRRRRVALGGAIGAFRNRLVFWLVSGGLFLLFGALGAWPAGGGRPLAPATAAAGDWPVLALIGLGVLVLGVWTLARHNLVPRSEVTGEDELAGQTVGLLALAIVAVLVMATNPYALLFLLPALHAWLWLPQVQDRRRAVRAAIFAFGLTGPALAVGEVAVRHGLGLDAPWYVLDLFSLGVLGLPTFVLLLATAAVGAQLATIAVRRYAPYPAPQDRPGLGPVRSLVRTVVLARRARRRIA